MFDWVWNRMYSYSNGLYLYVGLVIEVLILKMGFQVSLLNDFWTTLWKIILLAQEIPNWINVPFCCSSPVCTMIQRCLYLGFVFSKTKETLIKSLKQVNLTTFFGSKLSNFILYCQKDSGSWNCWLWKADNRLLWRA